MRASPSGFFPKNSLVRFLLDTHIALWAVVAPEHLSDEIQRQIADPANSVAVSIVTLWEIAIKRSVRPGQTHAPRLSARTADLAFAAADFDRLAIAVDHVSIVEGLPLHHRDPFDRLLLAQALGDGRTFLTRDKQLAAYGEFVMLV